MAFTIDTVLLFLQLKVYFAVSIANFRRSSYEVNVTENRPQGTSILQVMVAKLRPGAILTYSIVSSQKEFEIDGSTVSCSTWQCYDLSRYTV